LHGGGRRRKLPSDKFVCLPDGRLGRIQGTTINARGVNIVRAQVSRRPGAGKRARHGVLTRAHAPEQRWSLAESLQIFEVGQRTSFHADVVTVAAIDEWVDVAQDGVTPVSVCKTRAGLVFNGLAYRFPPLGERDL
jgi:hypothetical protein